MASCREPRGQPVLHLPAAAGKTLVGVNFRTAKRNIDEPVFGQLGKD